MMLLMVGCSHRTAPVELREKVAFDQAGLARALDDLAARYGCEAAIVNTCNRVEVYVARPESLARLDADLIKEFLAEFHQLSAAQLAPHLHDFRQAEAVRHLFRVAAGLDSMIVGEVQIIGQVKRAYETAGERGTVGPLLHSLFQRAMTVAKRVRSTTGISRGHASVSSAAVDYVKQVFDHFRDKTVLVIGAGKMGALTLRHLQKLEPGRILVANRSPDRALAMARECGGKPIPWENLDDGLIQSDIVLSTTGAPEPIVTWERYQRILPRRSSGTHVILDIAVPRDFDPRIHDGDRTCLFNIDDLKKIREQTLQERSKHIPPAEALIEEEVQKFLKEIARRNHGPVIARLTKDFEAKREQIVRQLFRRLDGRLNSDDCAYIEGAFRLLQSQFLHGPISALSEEPQDTGHTLLEALRKLFRLHD